MKTTKKSSTKRSLALSTLSLVLCIAMLLGTTYAWFTDSVTSGKNRIVAGNLDVELVHSNANVTGQTVKDATDLFVDKNGNAIKWEPGVIAYENFAVKNVGTLALKYALNLNIFDKNALNDHDLSEVIKVAVSDTPFSGERADAQGLTFTSLADFQKTGNLAAGATDKTYGVVLYWQPTDNDNLWNVNNGQKTSDNGTELFIEFGVNLVATQDTVEADSFDKYYDKNATFPNIPAVGTKASATVEVPADKSNGMTIKNDLATLEIPAANIDEDASKYRLDVKRIENIAEGQTGAVSLMSDTNTLVTFDVSLVKITASTEAPVTGEASSEYTVTLYVGTHCELIKLYHEGTEITNFTYNPATGEVKYKTKSFSPYAGEIKFAGGEGTEKYPYLLANVNQIQAISEEFSIGPACYKIDDSLKGKTIDASVWTPLNFWGDSFDGNGVTFENLGKPLFEEVCSSTATNAKAAELKNFKIKNAYVSTESYYVGLTVIYAGSSITFTNVDVSGYIDANTPTAYVGQGNYGDDADSFVLTLNNCKSDATLVSKNNQVAAFSGNLFGNYYNKTSSCSVILNDTLFTGAMSCTGNSCSYLEAHTVSCNWEINYSDKFAQDNADIIDGLYSSGASQTQAYTLRYLKSSSKTVSVALEMPEIGNAFTVTKDENAAYARAVVIVGVNPGNLTGVYVSETISLENSNETFTTEKVRNYNVYVNDGVHDTSIVGDNLYVKRDGYDSGYACVSFLIVQYNQDGAITSIHRCGK